MSARVHTPITAMAVMTLVLYTTSCRGSFGVTVGSQASWEDRI